MTQVHTSDSTATAVELVRMFMGDVPPVIGGHLDIDDPARVDFSARLQAVLAGPRSPERVLELIVALAEVGASCALQIAPLGHRELFLTLLAGSAEEG